MVPWFRENGFDGAVSGARAGELSSKWLATRRTLMVVVFDLTHPTRASLWRRKSRSKLEEGGLARRSMTATCC